MPSVAAVATAVAAPAAVAAAAAVLEGALMRKLATETEQHCMDVVKMQYVGATAATHTIVVCSALQHTLAMCAASVQQVTALLNHSTAGHA
jgi:hypothetical protein